MSCILRQKGRPRHTLESELPRYRVLAGIWLTTGGPEVTVWKRDPDSSHRNDTSNFISHPFLQYLGE
jgi:hypothetical protein